ncbi:aminotransferase class V-fold PLP-dependent enzyme [Microbacterium sp. 2MCAF23]|uniref:aminotransferase class V-fold PLP-dependent enzyme n=1 Tax=Microbacterium sp. 2MCAF23 TaxID=3232985 RepID=UPI003F998531
MTAADQGPTGRFVDRLEELRVVNAVGPATRMGGLGLHDEVLAAMGRAVQVPVRMAELERAGGEHVARLLGAPAAYITAGAAAGLALAAAAAMARDDVDVIDSLPRHRDGRDEFVIQAAQRDPYDRAVEAAGGRIVAVGYPGSTHAAELASAIGERTAAVLYRPGAPGNHVDLDRTCAIAHAAGVPVIVDGALRIPPLTVLHEYIAAGADLLAVSGGKLLRGPQASGLLIGQPEWIARVGVHHQDMDEREETWPAADGRFVRPPRHGIARFAKVGREQLVGLVTAVERFVAGADDTAVEVEELRRAHQLLAHGPLGAVWEEHSVLGSPEVIVTVRPALATRFVRALRAQHPPVYVEESGAWRGVLSLNSLGLTTGDGERIAASFAAAVRELGIDGEGGR